MIDLNDLTKNVVIACGSNDELASYIGLSSEDTTIGMNGYPEETCEAIVSDSLQELEEVANRLKELGFEVTYLELHRRDGWHLWNRKTIPFFTKGQYMQVDDQDTYFDYNPDTSEEDTKEELFNLVVGEDTPVSNYVRLNYWHEKINELYSEMSLSKVEKRYFLDIDNNYSVDYSVSFDSTGFSFDTHNYQMAIMVEDFDIDIDED